MKDENISINTKSDKEGYKDILKKSEEVIDNLLNKLLNKKDSLNNKIDASFNSNLLTRAPKIDFIDRNEDFLVLVEFPGIEKKNMDVSISENQLVVKTLNGNEEDIEEGSYLKKEITRKNYFRSILLSSDIVNDNVSADFKNGVLTLVLPKQKYAHRQSVLVE